MKKPRILIVDDELGMVSTCVDVLESHADELVPDVDVETATASDVALEMLAAKAYDLLVTDLRMEGMDGQELLKRAREVDPDIVVIMITAYPTVESADAALRTGALEYLVKPFTAEQLRLVVGRGLSQRRLLEENRWLRRQLRKTPRADGLVGTSAAMEEVAGLISRVAQSASNVLILGETGTGKSLIARTIHAQSPRRAEPFVQVDCGAFPDHLLESELFGHEKGSFTGAHEMRRGLLECADGGTFFLDEVCELPLPLQAKLLGLLQDRSFRRIGGRMQLEVDVRLLTSTNRDIAARVKSSEFREDLYYRLDVIQLTVPPLRKRLEDVPLLATHFIQIFNRRNGTAIQGISPRALLALRDHDWPGNVRELENVIERACSLTFNEVLDLEDLPEVLRGADPQSDVRTFAQERAHYLRRFERAYLENLLQEAHGNVKEAAARADLPRTTMYRYLEKYQLIPRRFR